MAIRKECESLTAVPAKIPGAALKESSHQLLSGHLAFSLHVKCFSLPLTPSQKLPNSSPLGWLSAC